MRARAVSLALITVTVLGGAACSNAPLSQQGPAPAVRTSAPEPPPAVRVTLPKSPLSQDQQITHTLNRLGYGPRPGDVERVLQMGLARWIERQLEPGRIPDDRVEVALQAFPTLTMPVPELVRAYAEPDQKILAKLRSGQMSQEEMRAMAPPEKRPFRIAAELQAAKLTRAVLSERQLEEVMTDFWFNHFNVDARKGAVKWMVADYERTAIRPHALGKFRDLLLATAHHPAMLFYLDNWMSTKADLVPVFGPNRGRKRGLNENYAREIMELHTLGVDGGYTQEDVIEVARAFTGWTIDRPREQGTFQFQPVAHDNGAKRVLGHVLPAYGGEQDGVKVIDILSRHPSTAKFVATKLTRRFVSDEPPPALVERAAKTFRDTDGDIRMVVVTIITSPEFFSAEAYRAKIKTPLEIVASSVRAVDADVQAPGAPGSQQPGGGLALAQQVNKLGEPLYQQQPPTGYPDVAEAWVNTGALLNRMNFALGLTANRVPGVRVDLSRAVGSADRRKPEQVLDALLRSVLQGQVTSQTRSVLAAQLDDPEVTRATRDDRGPADTDVEKLAALVLGSPEFQRR
ncbi:MAG: DUF1800 domain-containing protein [Candidatus Rokubacteria bacterium]|nr:DUF1800 domain-containing protein [Candidatus Rokubacteria bacterium]